MLKWQNFLTSKAISLVSSIFCSLAICIFDVHNPGFPTSAVTFSFLYDPQRAPSPNTRKMDKDGWWQEAVEEDVVDLVASILDESSTDEEEPRRGGSVPGKASNIDRHAEQANNRLYLQYFSSSPIYDDATFQRRFRVSRAVFQKVFDRIIAYDDYFPQKRDCTEKIGLSPYQKVTAAFRMLAYGTAADSVDEVLGMGESTVLLSLQHFVRSVNHCFGPEYLREPNEEDLKRILRQSAARGFPGMIGSIDCCKWEWKNCPTSWHGQYQGKDGKPVVALEAICVQSLWIWHAFFGMPGSGNDINVVEASTLTVKIAAGTYPPPLEYLIGSETRNKPYWLADGIYTKWPVFLQTITFPSNKKEECLARNQECARKDVERAFGVLQSKWHIIARPARFWSKQTMKEVMQCCIILHNMMVEDRGGLSCDDIEDGDDDFVKIRHGANPMWGGLRRIPGTTVPVPGTLAALCEVNAYLNQRDEYYHLRRLVINHLWEHEGNN